jgi:predicted dienelactone hydrolase
MFAFPAIAVEKEQTLHQPHIEIWVPPTFLTSETKWPLVIFSHGFGACGKQAAFLMEHMADNGYIVAAPNHEDARWCRDENKEDFSKTDKWPEKPFRFPEQWSEKTEQDRGDDIIFVLEDMLKNRKYRDYIDQERVGLIGHSLGGYTALGLSGAWESWKDARFKAVVALSPFVQPFLIKQTLPNVSVPVMYQGGTRDAPVTPIIKKSLGAYETTNAPKYFVELENANHFAWTQPEKRHQDIIKQTVLAFFDKYLKGQSVEVLKAGKAEGIATYWQDEEGIKQKAPSSVDEQRP